MDENLIIIEGTWLYDHQVPNTVRIIKSDILYGSRDYEDPEDIRENQDILCYYIQFESLTQKGYFNAGGGSALSVSEAMAKAEKLVGQPIIWNSNRKPPHPICPGEFCFLWSNENHCCRKTFGPCNRADKNSRNDYYESNEPELRQFGLPWFYFILDEFLLNEELKSKYRKAAKKLWR